jgi:hypothetical protein
MDERLNQALRTLRAIRQRYETGSDAGSGSIRSYTVQVGLGYADMLWIAAAIEALEMATTTSRNEQTSPENRRALSADSSSPHGELASQLFPHLEQRIRGTSA